MAVTKPQPRARRIAHGRGHSYQLNGQKILGVTTILKEGFPKPALIGWAGNEVAAYVASRREWLAGATDEELYDVASRAPNRERDKAAHRGGEIHRLADQLARGIEVDVPEELIGHVDAHLGFLEDFRLTEGKVERPCFNQQWHYGGTFDLIARTERADLGRCMFDLKSGGKGIYGEIALQFAGYGHCEFYLDDNLQEQPMPPIDHYVAVWIRADGYDAYVVEVGEEEWAAFKAAARIAWWREWRERVVVGPSLYSRLRLETSA